MFALPKSRRTQRGLAVAALTLAALGAAAPTRLATANVVEGRPQGDVTIGIVRTPYAPPATGRKAAAAGVTVAVRDSRFGKILVDGQGRTLYLFEADKGTKSTCYGACAKAWPPLTTTGKPQAGSGVSPALLGTTPRTDHTTGVTYNGHPLYYFITDHKPGDITGQAVNSFGAPWFVLDPKGNKITKS